MSFNRLNYDQCTYKHNLRQSIGTGDYQLNTPRIECTGCFPQDPKLTIGKYGASLCGDKPLVDVDSELKIITRKASNCPTQKYLPQPTPFCNTVNLQDCRSVPQEDTRLSNPPCTMRGTGWNRWEWLCQNPQDKVFVPFDFNVSNRLIVKDNHRPCIPKPVDQSMVLPPMNQSDDMYEYRQQYDENTDIPSVHWRRCSTYNAYM